MKKRPFNSILAVLILTVAPAAALGQSKLDPGALPKSTAFYLAWHGTPCGDARKANSLLALWDDADFAPLRDSMFEAILRQSPTAKKTPSALNQEELRDYTSLLDNEFIVGYIGNPHPPKPASASSTSSSSPWNGMFLAYDRTGKEATLAKLLLRARTGEKDPPKISTTTIAGVAAIRVERKNDTYYWAEDGKYAFGASEPAVFEQIANWTKHSTGETGVLAQTAAYREAGDLLKGGLLEFFVHFPSIRETTWDTSAGGFRLRPLLQNLKLEAVHSIAGHVAVQGARTRVQAAVLGETTPGTLFDIWGEGTAMPSSVQFINSNTVSYRESRVNLPGIYGLIKRALQSTAGAGQGSTLDFIEAASETRLGMPLPAVFGLFSGEVTSLQTSPTLDPHKQVFILGIQKKPELLKVLRRALADRVASERTEGDATFLKISEAGMADAAGTASWKYYHLAVTNDLIVASRRIDSVRETLAQQTGTTDNSSRVPAAWQAARAQYPAKLTGLNFMDFQKLDWNGIRTRWSTGEAQKASANGSTGKASMNANTGAFSEALKDLDSQVFPRHLHLSMGAAWKDAQGVHFDGWIE